MISADHHRCECVSFFVCNSNWHWRVSFRSWVSFDRTVYVYAFDACWFYGCVSCCCTVCIVQWTCDALYKNHSYINITPLLRVARLFLLSVVVSKCFSRMIRPLEWRTRACNSHGQANLFFFPTIVNSWNLYTFHYLLITIYVSTRIKAAWFSAFTSILFIFWVCFCDRPIHWLIFLILYFLWFGFCSCTDSGVIHCNFSFLSRFLSWMPLSHFNY